MPNVQCEAYRALISERACGANIKAAEGAYAACKGSAVKSGRLKLYEKDSVGMDRLINCSKCVRAADSVIYKVSVQAILEECMRDLGRRLSAMRGGSSLAEDPETARALHALEEKRRGYKRRGRDVSKIDREIQELRASRKELMYPESTHTGAFGGRTVSGDSLTPACLRSAGERVKGLPALTEIPVY